MEVSSLGFLLSYWYLFIIGGIGLWFFWSSITIVGGNDIVMLERRWIGKKIPQGRIFALSNEVGIQARVLTPGLHILIPFIYKVYRDRLVQIHSNEVGLIESLDGNTVQTGHIFARVVKEHNSFQDGEKFLANGGEKGMQIEYLPAGEYRINTLMFKLTVVPIVNIQDDEVGLVVANDGATKPTGSLFAKYSEGHNNFQDGEKFLANNGGRGMQLDVLSPGTYRINTKLFEVRVVKATTISLGNIGLVTAKDGMELPKNEVVAKKVDGHNNYQNAALFLANGGQRGPQLEILTSGKYFINLFAFDVTIKEETRIELGTVGVITSSVGDVADSETRKNISGSQIVDIENGEVAASESYVVPEGYRGIQAHYYGPGKYFLNPDAYHVDIVKTTNITVDWDDKNERTFDALKVVSKDGFEIKLSVKVIVRVLPEQAPFMLAKIGSIQNLIDSVVHPIVGASFRNQASETAAMDFLKDRSTEQEKAETNMRKVLNRYNVECVSVLIVQIDLPQALMDTQTARIIAEQEQSQYKMETLAANERANREKASATADQQPDLVRAEIAVKVASQRKDEQIIIAEGNATAKKTEALADKECLIAIGDGEAKKIEAMGKAQANAFKDQNEAMGGAEYIYGIKVTEILADAIRSGKIKLVPDVSVSNGSAADGMFGTLAKAFPHIDFNKMFNSSAQTKSLESKSE